MSKNWNMSICYIIRQLELLEHLNTGSFTKIIIDFLSVCSQENMCHENERMFFLQVLKRDLFILKNMVVKITQLIKLQQTLKEVLCNLQHISSFSVISRITFQILISNASRSLNYFSKLFRCFSKDKNRRHIQIRVVGVWLTLSLPLRHSVDLAWNCLLYSLLPYPWKYVWLFLELIIQIRHSQFAPHTTLMKSSVGSGSGLF
jgi:hypothetical protein